MWLVDSTAPPPYKLRIDRLNVMAVFDRNRYRSSCALDTLLAIAVAVMACAMLMRAYFVDIQLILFWLVRVSVGVFTHFQHRRCRRTILTAQICATRRSQSNTRFQHDCGLLTCRILLAHMFTDTIG